jgi:DNA-directed RNA polymerase subunit G
MVEAVFLKFECIVKEIEKLRLPGMYRVKAGCDSTTVTVETYEKIMMVQPGWKLIVEVTDSKDDCMKHDFCGQGYVVSNKKVEEKYRVVISLHGPLIVVYSDKRLRESIFNTMSKVYVGITAEEST